MSQLFVCLLMAGALAEGVTAEFIPSGVTARVGGYRPSMAKMDQEADIIKTAPEGLEAPKYGLIEIGEKSWAFVLDEPEEKPAKLYIDTNADGDLTNDPETEWQPQQSGDLTMYFGEGKVDLGEGKIGTIGIYRFDPEDERREQLKDTLLYYSDFGNQYTLTLDGEELRTFAAGTPSKGQSLPIDRDGNGDISYNYEMVTLGEPFNFTGTTYVLSLEDGVLTLSEADEALPQLPMPPDLSIGKPALEFAATTMDGEKIEFPKTFAGKLVMLDFWATWCGPCIGEIPNMKEAYEDWHDKGFEILGVSLDSEGTEEEVKEFLKEHELAWPQIYEGQGWQVSLAKQYDVSGIPFVLLVDGDSGEILATARQLRGEGLTEFIGQSLEKKNPSVNVEKAGKVEKAEADDSSEEDR